MPYRRTRSLSSGRREEREKQLNIHRPIESGMDSSSTIKVGRAQNAFPLAGSLAGVCVVVNGGYSRQPFAEPMTKNLSLLIAQAQGVVLW